MDPNTTAIPPPLPAHLPSSPSAPQDRPTFGHKLANGITENQVALRHQSIPPNKGMFGQERLSAGGEANLTGIWAGSTAVYRWKTVCESKSSLKTFEDVWQVPVPKAAMCWERTHGPLKTEQPKGYLPRSLLREQSEKLSIQGGHVGMSYRVFKKWPSSGM